jgi:hypothetical protein
MGINAFSPEWPESLRYILLLPPPSLLTTDESRRVFESALERVRRRSRLQVYGYVIMPEHVHLLLSEPELDGAGCPTLERRERAGPFLGV